MKFIATKGFGSPAFLSVGDYKITRTPRRRVGYRYRVHVLIDRDAWKYRKLPGEHLSRKAAEQAAVDHAIAGGDKQARSTRALVTELEQRIEALEAQLGKKR